VKRRCLRPAWRLVPAAVGIAVTLLGCGDGAAGRHGGWPVSPPASAPDILLHAAGGRTLSLARPNGLLSVVTFGYTACPDVCPTTLADWRRVRARLGRDADRVRFVFVSIDYRHDTPEIATAFANNVDPGFIGVAVDSQRISAVLAPFKAEAAYETSPDG
jgi:protein SCO1/2